MARVAPALILTGIFICSQADRAESPQVASVVPLEVSIADIEQTLHAIDVDRTAGSGGERASADYLVRQLTEYGIAHTRYDSRLYLSWPGRAELDVAGVGTIQGKTAAFSASTPKDGVRGALVFEPKLIRRVDRTLRFDSAVEGTIAVVRGIADTEALVLAGQQAGALGIIQIDATDTLHEDIVTTIWGTPTPESATRLPKIPYICIKKSDGDRLRSAAQKATLVVALAAEVTRGWRTIPLLVADVPGRTPDFLLVATHLDAWYRGMTDTGTSVASMLDMARVLQRHRDELYRGVRFAWWPGHSFGRYAGSTWYVDRFWSDLDRHCVAYTNLDGPGRRGSQLEKVSAGGWPGIEYYARESAARLTGKVPPARDSARAFRPGRDSDSAFQGLGIPFLAIGVPGPPKGHPDVDIEGRIAYWHTAEDTFDKIDLKALEVDTRYRVAQLYDLSTSHVLPLRLVPIAAAYVAALRDLASGAGSAFDLTQTLKLAGALEEAATRLDRAPAPTAGDDVTDFNALVVRLTHKLNSILYTRAGRWDQDPASELPVLPLLARVKDLTTLSRDGDEFGFLETGLIRSRNEVESALRDATGAIEEYLSRKS